MKLYVYVVAVVALGLLGVAAAVWLRPAAGPGPVGARLDEVARAGEGAVAPGEEAGFLGVLIPAEAVDVAARAGGRIETVAVRLGDEVESDAVIAALESHALHSQLAMTRAALQAARAEEQRAAAALEEARERRARWTRTSDTQPVVSEEELANLRYKETYAAQDLAAARARVAEKQAELGDLERKLAESVVRAPFAGRVAARYVDPGAIVERGTALVRLVSSGDLWVRFAVPERRAAAVAVGRAVRVQSAELGVEPSGTVEKVAPEIDPASGMIIAEARLEAPPERDRAPLSGRVVRVYMDADGAVGVGEPAP